jgi:hypothetical protein
MSLARRIIEARGGIRPHRFRALTPPARIFSSGVPVWGAGPAPAVGPPADPCGDAVQTDHRDRARAALALRDRGGYGGHRRHRPAGGLQHAACQHDDFVDFPRAAPPTGGRRRPDAAWRRRRPPVRRAGSSGASTFRARSLLIRPGSPADFDKFIADDTEKWGKVVKASGIGRNRQARIFILFRYAIAHLE